MKPNFYQQITLIAYVFSIIFICIFFVPFGNNKIEFGSLFSTKPHLVTFRFLTEIIVITIPTVILYKTFGNYKEPNYTLKDLLVLKNKKSIWLYAFLILFVGGPYFYEKLEEPSVAEKARMEAEAKAKMDSLFNAASQSMGIDTLRSNE